MSKQRAEEYVERYLEENKKLINNEFKKSFIELFIYGTTTITRKLPIEDTIEKYKDILTEKEIQELSNYVKK